jgi:iron complex transport system substrate-binding protein
MVVRLAILRKVGQAVSPALRLLPAILLVLWGGAILRPQQVPKRIVSMAPSITEMLYALGLGDRVVGVTTFCHYPPEAARKPKIGTTCGRRRSHRRSRPDLVT